MPCTAQGSPASTGAQHRAAEDCGHRWTKMLLSRSKRTAIAQKVGCRSLSPVGMLSPTRIAIEALSRSSMGKRAHFYPPSSGVA